ncbi:MAG: ATP-binding cassette domain-containing protein, partial [Spirochaetes bacterium]|nr:ATP-binding cassette domain-containing protein [Spirochaetota bacterium]
MHVKIKNAFEHNLKNIDVDFYDGLTAVTGISGSGKTSLVYDTLYKEIKRRFREAFGSSGNLFLEQPAHVEKISNIVPALSLSQNTLNRNPHSIIATASGLHPLLRILFSQFGKQKCFVCQTDVDHPGMSKIIAMIQNKQPPLTILAVLTKNISGNNTFLMHRLIQKYGEKLYLNNNPYQGQLNLKNINKIELLIEKINTRQNDKYIQKLIEQIKALQCQEFTLVDKNHFRHSINLYPICPQCGTELIKVKPPYFNLKCSLCQGSGCNKCFHTGLHPYAAAVTFNQKKLNQILNLSITEAHTFFQQIPENKRNKAFQRILKEIQTILNLLQNAGLSYLALDRAIPTLSRGEAQRLRLSIALKSQLEDMLHIIDEPTIGLHASDVDHLLNSFKQLSGPVIFIEHDKNAVIHADRVIDIGPQAGELGGKIMYNGSPRELWKSQTLTSQYFKKSISLPEQQPKAAGKSITFEKAKIRNLKNISVTIPLNSLTVISGVSGSGKSTLAEEVIYKSLQAKKNINCEAIFGEMIKPLLIDQSPIGKNSRSNPATYTQVSNDIRTFFSQRTQQDPAFFSFNHKKGACPRCQGLGIVELELKFLPSIWEICSLCAGRKFNDKVLELKTTINQQIFSIADIYEKNIAFLYDLFQNDQNIKGQLKNNICRILHSLIEVGLGYLELGQPSPTLSGGEAQRIKLAKYLSDKNIHKKIIILDEPTTGLHPYDVENFLKILSGIKEKKGTIITVEHNTDFIQHADWIIDLGPGSGPRGGELIYQGSIADFHSSSSKTALAIQKEKSTFLQPAAYKSVKKNKSSKEIKITNAKVNNLKNISVSIQKKELTVITGISGSGKSSLFTTIKREARKRYLESLTSYEKQNTKEKPDVLVDRIEGLGLAVSLSSDNLSYNIRSNVGNISGISHSLSIIYAFLGKRLCPECGTEFTRDNKWECKNCGFFDELPLPRYFSSDNYHGACVQCHGIGTINVPNPDKLIIAPHKPLCSGAMYSPGFFPQGYISKPYNGGYYLLQALAKAYGFDPFTTPWNQMSQKA